ncbi:MAG: TetR/AcrR family transcriptional regulator [Deltaproteobacteria bacterium]|nr:TetR/AcrR family transcriptional regulator [Deltaproteobacteria bacterium]MBW2123489.1 TetR/AcrR family transcriptional regulator [Deltaproteobacteria bacterium]
MTGEVLRDEQNARERLLESAMELFAEKGYEGVSVREIVQGAKVTKPVLYYYFGNKEGLYQTLVEEALETYRGVLEIAMSKKRTVLEQLVEMVSLQLDFCQKNQRLVRFIYSVLFNPPVSAPPYDFDRFYQANLTALKEIVNRGVEKGELEKRSIEEVAFLLLGLVNIHAMNQIFSQGTKIPEEVVQKGVEIVYQGIRRTRGRDR